MKPSRYPITTHVLDTSRGKPAVGITVVLETLSENDSSGNSPMSSQSSWKTLATEKTDQDGRVRSFSGSDTLFPKGPIGIYRLTFEVEPYFKALNLDAFYPRITVVFQIKNPSVSPDLNQDGYGGEHYHVPLLLNPYGYSTYRGT